MVGHALIVDKNFVEMVAMLMLATTAVGRWGGLDYFLYHWIGRPSRCESAAARNAVERDRSRKSHSD